MIRTETTIRNMLVALLGAGLAVGPAVASADSLLGRGAGEYKITYYWIVNESELGGTPSVPLYTVAGKPIAVVSDEFAQKVSLEGTGVLADGRVVNLHEECSFARYGWCFMEVDLEHAPFGYGSVGPLHPFRTIAVPESDLAAGTVIYVPQFDGMALPSDSGGFEFHDGCFVVEDTGYSLDGRHMDVFAHTETNYEILDRQLGGVESVDVFVDSPLCPGTAQALFNPAAWADSLLSLFR